MNLQNHYELYEKKKMLQKELQSSKTYAFREDENLKQWFRLVGTSDNITVTWVTTGQLCLSD